MVLSGITSREAAEQARGSELKVPETQLPPLEADEYYLDDLRHLTVKSQETGQILGTVQEILSSTAGEFLEVVSPHLTEPVLVSFCHAFVPHVDLADKTLYVTGLDSLFTPAE
jgi:16S rRNA processing protein RimM